MARTKGAKNREGHKAGGARKGAGRKRKSSIERVSEDEEPLEYDPNAAAGPSSPPDHLINVNQIHPALKQYITTPHHVPLVVTPIHHAQQNTSNSMSSFRLSYAAWDSTEDRAALLNGPDSLSAEPHTLQNLVHPVPSQPSRSLQASLTSFYQQSESGPAHLDVHPTETLPDELNTARTELSKETLLHIEEEPQLEAHVQEIQQPESLISEGATTQPLSRSRPPATRRRLVNIAPAPLSPQQQRTWMFPYSHPASVPTPFHRLAVVSQILSSSKRRRRRCAVCIQLGKEEASYECPGRGDRSRCPFSRKTDEAAGIPPKHRRRLEPKPKESETSTTLGSKSVQPVSGSTLQPIAPAPPQPPMLIPRGYLPLTSLGHPVQHFVLSSADTAKRRGRRCMVCVARGREGTSCPGRGSRTWCPDYDAKMDARTIKWPVQAVEKDPEPEGT